MIEKKLSQYGHSVIVASDGQEAHDKFVTSGIGAAAVDVILMDLKVCYFPFPCSLVSAF
jgi:CheY-like chemotaxis protein